MNLAEIAVELRLATAPLPEVAFAAFLETVIVLESRKRLEEIAARIGLSRDTADRILWDQSERARLLGEAHRIIKALIPHEDEVTRLIEAIHPLAIPIHADAAHP